MCSSDLGGDELPLVTAEMAMSDVILTMTAKRFGCAGIVDGDGRLLGVITDGDLRRLLLRSQKPLSALFADDIIDHARTEFTTVGPDLALQDALDMLQEREIFDLPVVDGDGQLLGVIHLHPALKALLHS